MSGKFVDLDEDEHPRLVRARAHWDVLVEKKLRVFSAQSRQNSSQGVGLETELPTAVGNARVDTVLLVADRLRRHSQQVARILCEHAYTLAQVLDPNSQRRGMLQLKTGLLSIITQKKSKQDGQSIDRRNDAILISDFYKAYRKKIDKLEAEEEQWHERADRGDGVPAQESKKRVAKIKEGYQTFRVLNEVLDTLIPNKEEKKALLQDQQGEAWQRRDIESDAARASEYKPYNILPLETPNATHLFDFLPQIKGALSVLALENGDGDRQQDRLPALPTTVPRPNQRSADILDLLQYIFGFQKDNVNNQREHIILLLANTHARVAQPDGQANDLAVSRLHDKVLDNYQRWCTYLRKESACRRGNSVQVKLLLTALYLLIWGEAGNARFLPECLCYIFHNMASELLQQLDKSVAVRAREVGDGGHEFLDKVINPVYSVIAAEAKYGKGKSHSEWRNYDDLNEYFWSENCFSLGWPMVLDKPFFQKPSNESASRWGGQKARMGKTLFAEHRTGLHVFHSFHRLWIFFLVMLQILALIAFTSKLRGWHRVRLILSCGPTYLSLKLIQSVLDVLLMFGAYKSTRGQNVARVFVRLLWFVVFSAVIIVIYVQVMSEANLNRSSALFNLYILIIGVYTAALVSIEFISRISSLRLQVDKIETWHITRFISWVNQERYYVGRGMYETTKDFLIYAGFWLVVLAAKFSFSYFFMIKPLVNPTKVIYDTSIQEYNWYSFLSKNHHNTWTLASLWGPVVLIYFLDTQVWYTVFSAIWGGVDGAIMRLGEIRSLNMLRNRFRSIPEEFVKKLVPVAIRAKMTSGAQSGKSDAQRFAPIWNEIIRNLRDEDYISNRERDLLWMPKNIGRLQEVQWPLFLLANKIALASNLSGEHKGSQQELEREISLDQYMLSAVREAYASVRQMLETLVQDPVEQTWVQNVFQLIDEAKANSALVGVLSLKILGGPDGLVSRLGDLTKDLISLKGVSEEDMPSKYKQITKSLSKVFEKVMQELLGRQLREKFISSDIMRRAGEEPELLFTNINCLSTHEEHEATLRLHNLLTIKVSAASVPKNDEARRRLQFFSNSLFMDIPATPSLQKMFSFSVLTPYYAEDVMFSYAALNKPNEDGITILFYLQKIFPDEWNNYLERMFPEQSPKNADREKQFSNHVLLYRKNLSEKQKVDTHDEGPILQLRLWASYRGQTLARTVRGMMYYRSALMLLSQLEDAPARDEEAGTRPAFGAVPPSLTAQSVADIKFSYVVSCQIYGSLKKSTDVAKLQKAADIGYLLRSHEGLRVAYIHSEERMVDNRSTMLFFSKLVKADAVGEQEIYSIQLPGDPLLGEGKPENQNHAIVFTRGDAIQTIDMNQDNYFEETVKMRNLLQEFDVQHGLRKPSILGVREHVFTGSVSSLGWFMSNQETSFVTLGQRVLAKPLKVRMHYGHPDVFDRLFHISRGGISKASKVINISEDIYAGFNSTLRQGNVTHHEYIQVGKGRDVGLNQIAIFEGKVAGGNGEQVLSRDIYRLGQLLDPFRMLSFFYTSVGFYICTMMTVLTVFVFLYGKVYLALSGVETSLSEEETNNTALQAALNTQFLFQIGVFTAVPMIMNTILELGVLKALAGFVQMQLQAASVFFTFSLGTRTHYFGRTILHGGAKYRSTGRGFVVQHISFAENYRLFSRSHFIKGLEVALLLIVYGAYGSSKGTMSYVLLTFSSWFLALSWLYAPFLFNPSGFEWQKAVEDFDNWSNWIFYKGGVGVSVNESWEAWWEDEISHISTFLGRVFEIILSLRFLIFQYGVVYSLNVTGTDNNLTVYGISWLVLVGLLVLFKAFTISQRAAAKYQLLLRLVQTIIFGGALFALIILIVFTTLSVSDVFAASLAILPTGWTLLSIGVAIKPVMKALGLWKTVRSLARFYDALFGILIFVPIAILSWFPFVSTFQTRLVFNQAFSRGLEISLILSGKQEEESEESRERVVCPACQPVKAEGGQNRVVCYECRNVLGQGKKKD